MRTLGTLLLALGAAPAGLAALPLQEPPPKPAAQESPFRDLSLEQALAEAARRERVVLVDFFATWCQPCKELDRTTWSDPDVRAWLAEHTVAVKIDAEEHTELAQERRVSGYPTIVLLAPDGVEIERIRGYVDAERFLQTAQRQLGRWRQLSAAREAAEQRPDDAAAHLELARVLRRAQRLDEAAASYERAWSLGAGDPAMAQERAHSIPGELGAAMRRSPEAGAALLRLREATYAALTAPAEAQTQPREADPQAEEQARARAVQLARELRALNHALGQADRSLTAWEQLRRREGFPQEALDVLLDEAVVSMLLHQRRYAELAEGLGDAVVRLQARLSELEARKREDGADAALLLRERNLVVAEAGRYLEALLGAGKRAQAADVRELLLAFEPTAHAYNTLAQAARRAGDLEAARALVEQGLARLPGVERERFERLSARMDLSGG